MDDYNQYRGKCREMSEELVAADPSLKLVRGFYFCPIWNSAEQHWWCENQEGKIIDPTAKQFPSKGMGTYIPFNGDICCENCGKVFREGDEKASYEGRYAFCSYRCHGQFVGVF